MSNIKSFLLEYIQNELKTIIESELDEVTAKELDKSLGVNRGKTAAARGANLKKAIRARNINNTFDLTSYLNDTKDFKSAQKAIDGKKIKGFRPGDKIIGYKDGRILVKDTKGLFRVTRGNGERIAATSNGRILNAKGKYLSKGFDVKDFISPEVGKRNTTASIVYDSKKASMKKGAVDPSKSKTKSPTSKSRVIVSPDYKPKGKPGAQEKAFINALKKGSPNAASKAIDKNTQKWAKETIKQIKNSSQFRKAAEKGVGAVGRVFASKLGQRVALLAAGPAGIAIGAVLAGVDVVMLGKYALELIAQDATGGTSKGDVGAAAGAAASQEKVAALQKKVDKLKKVIPKMDKSARTRWDHNAVEDKKKELEKAESELSALQTANKEYYGSAAVADRSRKELAKAKKANKGSKRSMRRLRDDFLKVTAYQGDKYELKSISSFAQSESKINEFLGPQGAAAMQQDINQRFASEEEEEGEQYKLVPKGDFKKLKFVTSPFRADDGEMAKAFAKSIGADENTVYKLRSGNHQDFLNRLAKFIQKPVSDDSIQWSLLDIDPFDGKPEKGQLDAFLEKFASVGDDAEDVPGTVDPNAVAGGVATAAAIAAGGASGGATGGSRSKAARQKRLLKNLNSTLEDLQKTLAIFGFFGPDPESTKTFSKTPSGALKADGKYGDETEGAIKKLQRALIDEKLLPKGADDGLFGPNTFRAMNKSSKLKKSAPKAFGDTTSTSSQSAGTTLTAAGAKMLKDPEISTQLDKVAKDTGSDVNLLKKDPTLVKVANDLGKGMGSLQKLSKIIKDLEKKYKKEKEDKDAADRKKTADNAATATSKAGVAKDQARMQSYSTVDAKPQESKAYAYLEKLINEELDKILG